MKTGITFLFAAIVLLGCSLHPREGAWYESIETRERFKILGDGTGTELTAKAYFAKRINDDEEKRRRIFLTKYKQPVAPINLYLVLVDDSDNAAKDNCVWWETTQKQVV